MRRTFFLSPLLAASLAAQAQNFTVTTTDDLPDTNVGDLDCRNATGACSLRAAVQEADFWAIPSVITLEQGNHVLDLAPAAGGGVIRVDSQIEIVAGAMATGDQIITQTIPGQRALEVLDASLTLTDVQVTGGTGPTGANVRVDGTPAAPASLTLDGSEIHGGASAGRGGGIFVGDDATLTITGASEVHGNSSGTDGGGILVDAGGTLFVDGDSAVYGNTAGSDGGGILGEAGSTMTVSDSALHGNDAVMGGGIAARGTATLDRLAVYGNTASDDAGGVLIDGGSGTLDQTVVFDNDATERGGGLGVLQSTGFTVDNSTFSGNVAGLDGGGIAIDGDNVALSHVTVAANDAGRKAGGILVTRFSPAPLVQWSVFADNTSTDPGTDCHGPLASGGATSLVQTADPECAVDAGPWMAGVPAGLAPLADNGGGTLTHAFTSSSSACIDAAAGSPETFDQRGESRTVTAAGLAPDLGAFEAQ